MSVTISSTLDARSCGQFEAEWDEETVQLADGRIDDPAFVPVEEAWCDPGSAGEATCVMPARLRASRIRVAASTPPRLPHMAMVRSGSPPPFSIRPRSPPGTPNGCSYLEPASRRVPVSIPAGRALVWIGVALASGRQRSCDRTCSRSRSRSFGVSNQTRSVVDHSWCVVGVHVSDRDELARQIVRSGWAADAAATSIMPAFGCSRRTASAALAAEPVSEPVAEPGGGW